MEAPNFAWKHRHKADPGECPYCDREREAGNHFHPSHDASHRCESGKRNHCSCDDVSKPSVSNMAVTHIVKCWPPYFQAIHRKEKKFDVRRDDRGYQKGDTLILREFDPKRGSLGSFTGNDEHRTIKYILTGGQFGIEPGFVVLGF